MAEPRIKKYNLALLEGQMNFLREQAITNHTNILEIIRRSIRMYENHRRLLNESYSGPIYEKEGRKRKFIIL